MNIIYIALLTALLSGCASVAVSQKAIEQKTEFALGLSPGTYSISNRQDQGVQTRYIVKTDTGKHYNCYVTGSIGVLGPAVSDAMCAQPGEPVFNPLLGR